MSFLRWFLARFRLSDRMVCSESATRGVIDYHDYEDSTIAEPWHFHLHTCKRCGKLFYV